MFIQLFIKMPAEPWQPFGVPLLLFWGIASHTN